MQLFKTHKYRKGLFTAAAAVACLGLTGTASADRVNLLPFASSPGAPTGSLDVWVDVTDTGSDWEFVFHNDSSVSSSLTGIWFESGFRTWDLIAQGGGNRSTVDSSGVDFDPGAGVLPDGAAAGWTANGFSFGATSVANGVNSSEALTLRATKASGSLTLSDLLDVLSAEGTRIAAYVQQIDNDGNASLTTLSAVSPVNEQQPPIPSVPLPAAVWPGLALLGAMGFRRRRAEA